MALSTRAYFGILAAPLVSACSAPSAPIQQPVAAAAPAAHDAGSADAAAPFAEVLHGERVEDHFRWMEDDTLRLEAWLKAKDESSRAALAASPVRDKFMAVARTAAESGASITSLVARAKRLYYVRRSGSKLLDGAFSAQLDGSAATRIDIPGLAPDAVISWISVSEKGTRVAVGTTQGDSEKFTVFVLDANDPSRIVAKVSDASSRAFEWLSENVVAYLPLMGVPGDDGKRVAFRRRQIMRLEIDGGRADPLLGFSTPEGPSATEDETPTVKARAGASHLLGILRKGNSNSVRLFVMSRSGESSPSRWKPVELPHETVIDATMMGRHVVLLTERDGARALILQDAETGARRELLRSAQWFAKEYEVSGEFLYASLRQGASYELHRWDASGKGRVVARRSGESVGGLTADGTGGVLFKTEGWTTCRTWRHVARDGGLKGGTIGLEPCVDDGLKNLLVENLVARSKDGTDVPLTVVRPQNSSGPAPALLYGYGAYGMTPEPASLVGMREWFSLGGVYAVAHIRGGGEFGERWHESGFKTLKQNGVDDYIACASELLRSGISSSGRIGSYTGSAGGVAVGAAVVQRPDLFGASVFFSAVMNPLRSEFRASGQLNAAEYGSVKNPEEFRALRGVDSYANIRSGVSYPPVLLLVGANDARVPMWHSAKFAARMEDSGGRPEDVLLVVDRRSGHGFTAARLVAAEQQAEALSFLWTKLSRRE